MNEYSNAKELKEQASLVELLERLGYHPARRSGREQLYISMLRDDDKNPSLSVNDELGVWFDHGTRKGGNILDFGLAYWKDLEFGEVVDKLRALFLSEINVKPRRPRTKSPAVKLPHYIIEQVKDLGTHPAITDYLKGRGVFQAGKALLSEVYYYVEDQHGAKKHFFAAGWKNENGGWEVRNKYFKGCLGPKGLTILPGHQKNLVVFEGFINYLSWRSLFPDAEDSVMILNSLALLTPGIEKAKAFSSISLYLDRDHPGHMASRDFVKALPYASDRSSAYDGFNDYNDKLVAALPVKIEQRVTARKL